MLKPYPMVVGGKTLSVLEGPIQWVDPNLHT